jgi:hypothetical protein
MKKLLDGGGLLHSGRSSLTEGHIKSSGMEMGSVVYFGA